MNSKSAPISKGPSIKIKVRESQIQVETTYQIRFKKKENGTFVCAIPEFNIYFVAKNSEEVSIKADSFIDIFVGHYLDNNNKFSLRRFAVNLHRLGFKPANNPSALVNLMRNKPDMNTNFKIGEIQIPKEFASSSSLDRTNQFAVHA